MEEIRCQSKGKGAKPRKLDKARRRILSGRLTEYSAEQIITVARWLWTSGHDRAVFLRDPRYDYATMLRPGNFTRYLDLATEPETANPIEARSAPGSKSDGAAEAWQRVVKALRTFGPTPPNHRAHPDTEPWVFTNDACTSRAYDAAIIAAAKEASTVHGAWGALYRQAGTEDRTWQRRRFERAYTATLGSAAMRGAA